MNRLSEKGPRLGDERFDYVPSGLTRFHEVQELTEMVGEMNEDLDAVRAVLHGAQRNGGVPTGTFLLRSAAK